MPPEPERETHGRTHPFAGSLHLPRGRESTAIRVLSTAAEAAEAAAAIIVDLLVRKPGAVLGLATGATMEPVYRSLVASHRAGRVSFSRVSTFNLDEYVGLPPSHPQSYRATMHRLLFDHVDIGPERTHLPLAPSHGVGTACRAYERAIVDAGGIDLQLLGIGRNGHVGFNEPGSPADSRCREVALHASTLAANAPFFAPSAVPNRAVTMGIATILDARSIVVLATGAAKRAAVHRALMPDAGPDCPASWLQGHADVRWLLDRDAAPTG